MFDENSIVVLLQPTTPFTKSLDIDRCIQKLIDHHGKNTCVSVKKMTEYPEWAIISDDKIIGKCNQLSGENSIRQNLKDRWIPNGGIWAIQKKFLSKEKKILDEEGTLIYEMSKLQSIDIDEEEDFLLCQSLVNSGIMSLEK